jgi:hypothetical protein
MKKKVNVTTSIKKIYLYESGGGYCCIRCSGYVLCCPSHCMSQGTSLVCNDGHLYKCQ